MNAKMIWILIGLVALFATGVAVGVLYHHRSMHPHGGHPTEEHSTQFVDPFRKRLDRTEEQTAKVKDILDGLHKEMMGLSKDFRDKFSTARTGLGRTSAPCSAKSSVWSLRSWSRSWRRRACTSRGRGTWSLRLAPQAGESVRCGGHGTLTSRAKAGLADRTGIS